MRIEQRIWTQTGGWTGASGEGPSMHPQLVLVFGSNSALKSTSALNETRSRYQGAHVLGCSTAGEILGTDVHDDSVVSTAIEFASTTVHCASVSIAGRGGAGAFRKVPSWLVPFPRTGCATCSFCRMVCS
jgi:hypothetical protein